MIEQFATNHHSIVGNSFHESISSDNVAAKLISQHQEMYKKYMKKLNRDKFIVNAKGMEDYIIKVVSKILAEAVGDITKAISTNVQNDLTNAFYGIKTNGNNKKVISSNELAKMIGRELGSSLVKLYDDLVNDSDYY